MKAVQIRVWCDNCHAQGQEEIDAETTGLLTIPGVAPRTLDLCEPCYKDVFGELDALLADKGTFLAALPGLSGPQPSPSKTPKVSAAPQLPLALSAGLDTSIPAPGTPPPGTPDRDRVMWTCPLCDREMRYQSATHHIYSNHTDGKLPVQPTKCPTCGDAFGSIAACALHRWRVHQHDKVTEALYVAGWRP